MDRFRIDDAEDDGFDSVAPMRPSSFDLSFTLASSHVAAAADAEAAADAATDAADASPAEADEELTTSWRAAGHTLLADEPRKQAALADADTAAATASKLEEKAREALALASLSAGAVPWRLAKRHQDVHVYRPASLPESEQNKLYFRISCEVKASLSTILEYLAPGDTKSYVDIETQVFPGLLHAAVVKRMELPEHSVAPPPPPSSVASAPMQLDKDTASSFDDELGDSFPRLQIKWHASRFAGRFVKPVDFFFVEYATVETLPDGRRRGFGYLRSVESFKGDELATRLHSDGAVAIPPSVAKCKRAVINKGVYLVTPSGDATGTYEVTFMLVIDFQQQFPSSVGARLVQSFTDRLVGIRELLFNTLFQPVALVTKDAWKPARANKCAVCDSSFSIVKLVHHCRACGEAVCSQCSRKWVVQPGAHKETLKRLCTPCSLQARSYLMGGDARPPPPADLRSALDASFRLTTGSVSARSSARLGVIDATPPPPVCDVKVASAVSTDASHFTAVSGAFDRLCDALGGVAPHFMVVSYSKEYDGHAVYDALAHCAPDTLFMGGTSSAGVFSERGSVGRGPGLALWGIFDPDGSYAVLNADLGVENPRDAARRCVVECMAMLCMDPEESPDVVWMNARTGSEELLVATVNQVVDCAVAVVGGSSARNHLGVSTIPATQLCSEGSTVGCVTTHGACFAVCCPSVEVSRALFTCYTPKEKVFAVTKTTGRALVTIGHKPAFAALNDACHGMLYEFINRPESFNAETHALPSFYPVARERSAEQSKHPTLQFHVVQPEHASRDMVLHLGAEVQLGERLRMMAVEPDGVRDKIGAGFREALQASLPALDATDVIGCLASVGLGYSKVLGGDLKALAEATARALPHAAVLGAVSHGQQGVFHGASDAVHANGMVSALLVSNRKKLPRHTRHHLQPLVLRRISTY